MISAKEVKMEDDLEQFPDEDFEEDDDFFDSVEGMNLDEP